MNYITDEQLDSYMRLGYGAIRPIATELLSLRKRIKELEADRERLMRFARKVEPDLANIAYNNRPHSQVYRDLYDACFEIRELIYAARKETL